MFERTHGRVCRPLLASMVALATIVASCGSDDSGSSSTAAPTTTGATTSASDSGSSVSPATDPAATSTAGEGSTTTDAAGSPLGPEQPASGEPVVIGFVTVEDATSGLTNLPTTREAAEAVVAYANEHLGGLAGHPIELETCKDKGDGASGTACANRFAEANVAAVVVGQVPTPDLYVPILAAAGIPWIVASPTGQQEVGSPNVFALSSGTAGLFSSSAQYAKDQGWEKTTIFAIDVPAFTALFNALGKPAFDAAGIGINLVALPPGTPDATPQVTSGLAGGTDGIVIFADQTLCKALLPAIELANVDDAPLLMAPQCATSDVIDVVGRDVVEGAELQNVPIAANTGPEADLYRAVMSEYAPDTDLTGSTGTGYITTLGLVRAVNAAPPSGTIDAAAITAAFKSAKGIQLPGNPEGVTFTCDGTALPLLPAICSTSVIFGKVAGEDIVDIQAVDGSGLLR